MEGWRDVLVVVAERRTEEFFWGKNLLDWKCGLVWFGESGRGHVLTGNS